MKSSTASALVLAVLMAAPALASDLSVGPVGKDGDGRGSRSMPWATIQHAADRASPGDVVYVLDGDYPGFHVSVSGTRGVPITFLVVSGNRACGIHMNGDASQGGDGVITGAVVEANAIDGNGTAGGAAINADGVRDSRFVNNVIIDNRARGIALFKGDAAAPSTGNLVAHNTIVMAADARTAIGIKGGSTGATVINNILHAPGGRGDVAISSDSLPGLTSDRNVVAGRLSPDDGGRDLDLAGWRSATGQDGRSVASNPEALFLDPSRADFRLRPGSPAIDLAGPIPAVGLDRYRRPRPSGPRPDAGAYESTPR